MRGTQGPAAGSCPAGNLQSRGMRRGESHTPAFIALDFDGTLIDWSRGGAYVSPETQEALREAIARGIHVGLCSGRRWHAMRDTLAGIGLPWGQPFPSFVVTLEKLIYWVRDGRLDEGPFADWNAARSREMDVLARECLQQGPRWFAALEAAGFHHRQWYLWGDYGLEIAYDTPEIAEKVRLMLCDLVRDVANAHVHRNYSAAYVVPASGTKGISLRGMADILGVPPARILGVGDSLNDLDMVDGRYGLSGATMANGDPMVQDAVRAAGGHVASGAAEAGVGEIVRLALAGRWGNEAMGQQGDGAMG